MSKPAVHNSESSYPKRKKFWKIILWVFLILIILVVCLVYWVWQNRFSIVEVQIKNQLEAAGLNGELTVVELTETLAIAEDVRVSKDGLQLIEADRIEVDYIWQEAMEGRVKSVRLKGPKAVLTFDESGQFINPLGNNSENDRQSVFFPPSGIEIDEGDLKIISPFGNVETEIRGEIFSEDSANLSMTVAPSLVTYGDLSAKLSGEIQAEFAGDDRRLDLDMKTSAWAYKNMSGEALSLTGQVEIFIKPRSIDLKGPLKARLNKFDGKAVNGTDIDFNWDGNLGLTRGDKNTFLAEGLWSVDVGSFGVTDIKTRKNLADTLSLNDSLAQTPITRDFAEPLTASIEKLLKKASVTGTGHISKTPEQMRIKLATPIAVTGLDQTAVLKPKSDPDQAEYQFSRQDQKIRLFLDADLSGSYPMSVLDGALVFNSTNGRNIKGTESFDGQISLPQSWRSKTISGLPTEIRPLKARVSYKNDPSTRRLILNGRLNYDGDIPGGYAAGLAAEGMLSVRLGATTDLFFTPAPETEISMTSFDNPTEWNASNVRFKLLINEEKPLFSTHKGVGFLSATVSDLSVDLANLDASRTLDIKFGSADINARVAETQNWTIAGQDVVMTSDNTPSSGTVMTTPETSISAIVTPGRSPEFTIETPNANVKTQAVDAKGLAVQVAGTPEVFRVDYQNGEVNFSATEFDAFQMTGFVNYENDQWIGAADTFLPFDASTPVKVDYRFINSRGFADVEIPELNFSPSGLQPQTFIPALQGKIADVWGAASAKINLEFSEDGGVVSSGTARLIDMDMGTAPGPLSGLNSDLTFSSFFPLVTKGPQRVTIKTWDVGFPLPEGVIEFEAIADGIKVNSARWPVGSGQISLDPTTWRYTAAENRMQLRVEDVSIGEFLGEIGGKNFEATGNVSGILPVVISGVDVQVENGTLAVTDGGVVRFSTPFTDKAGETNGYAQLAFDALKEFYYEELEVSLNGPLDGLINIRVVFEGFNPNVMDGAYIRYNINIAGELLNIIRNFQNLGANITEEVKKAVLGKEKP